MVHYFLCVLVVHVEAVLHNDAIDYPKEQNYEYKRRNKDT